MAEISATSAIKQKGNKRLIKKSTRVDLTPMVDLGFLLITFFVFTTTMAKPKVMDIHVPLDSKITTEVCNSCVITVIPDEGNTIRYYEGMPEQDPQVKSISFTGPQLRDLLQKKKEAVRVARGSAGDMVLIIKPSVASSYKNFIDILDEVAITGVRHYFIDDVNEEDKRLLKKWGY
jgi:biopolymer transport protein ExbD